MSRITQFQRRAIESLWKDISNGQKDKVKWPKDISPDCHFFYKEKAIYKEKEVYYLGISNGVGSCSDIMGVNVAVFGNFGGIKPKPYSRDPLSSCQYAVLVRKPTPEETKQWNKPGVPHLTVELLYVARQDGNSIILRPYKNLKTTYCQLA